MFQMFHSCINIPENENTMISIIGLMECIVITFCIGTNVFVDRVILIYNCTFSKTFDFTIF